MWAYKTNAERDEVIYDKEITKWKNILREYNNKYLRTKKSLNFRESKKLKEAYVMLLQDKQQKNKTKFFHLRFLLSIS